MKTECECLTKQKNKKLKEDLDEALLMLQTLVERRYVASLGSLQSTDGRYEAALNVLIKHNMPFVTQAGKWKRP